MGRGREGGREELRKRMNASMYNFICEDEFPSPRPLSNYRHPRLCCATADRAVHRLGLRVRKSGEGSFKTSHENN